MPKKIGGNARSPTVLALSSAIALSLMKVRNEVFEMLLTSVRDPNHRAFSPAVPIAKFGLQPHEAKNEQSNKNMSKYGK